MVIEFSLIAAFLAMLCWGLGDFFIQKNTRKIGDLESLAFIGIFGSVFLFPFIIKDLPALLDYRNLLLLGFLGIVTFIAAMLNFEALKKRKIICNRSYF